MMSETIDVPALVPSVLQSSVPAASVVAIKNVRLPNAANSAGDDDFVAFEYVVLRSLTRYGVCAASGRDSKPRSRRILRIERGLDVGIPDWTFGERGF
jgi:hypothetical protein